MKANELMIGDWVRYDDGTTPIEIFQQVSGINGNYISIDGDVFCENYIAPIPLTEQMLKLNGFYHSDREGDSYYIVGLSVFVIPNQNTTEITPYLTDTYFYCRYVHELQHLLRLCGLTELADNFKID